MRTTMWLGLVGAVAGCGGGAETTTGGVDETPGDTVVEDPCRAEVLEDDFGFDPSLGDPADWALPPDAVVASTYLRRNSDAATFDALLQPVVAELMAGPAGLLGVSLAGSASCNTGRTLSAWNDEAAMLDFVTGPAHGAAMLRLDEVSRGGSITMSWSAAELGGTDWATVAAALAAHDGPVY